VPGSGATPAARAEAPAPSLPVSRSAGTGKVAAGGAHAAGGASGRLEAPV